MTLDVRWSADRGTCCCPLALSSLPLAHAKLMSPRCAGMLPGGARAQDLTFATNVISMTSQVSVSRGLSLSLYLSVLLGLSLSLSVSGSGPQLALQRCLVLRGAPPWLW